MQLDPTRPCIVYRKAPIFKMDRKQQSKHSIDPFGDASFRPVVSNIPVQLAKVVWP